MLMLIIGKRHSGVIQPMRTSETSQKYGALQIGHLCNRLIPPCDMSSLSSSFVGLLFLSTHSRRIICSTNTNNCDSIILYEYPFSESSNPQTRFWKVNFLEFGVCVWFGILSKRILYIVGLWKRKVIGACFNKLGLKTMARLSIGSSLHIRGAGDSVVIR